MITRDDLLALADRSIAAGIRVLAPVRLPDGRVAYSWIKNSAAIALDGFVRPVNSIKEAVFPRHETLYRYKISGNNVELEDQPPPDVEQLVLAARSCDAAALPILDHIFNWDYRDEFFNARRAKTTVVTLVCNAYDDECFCTSVGLSPRASEGSDVLLYEAQGGYAVRTLTDKGGALFPGQNDEAPPPGAEPPARFLAERVKAFLDAHFEDPLWGKETMRCLGCGACAYTCPTCHCFDIADEHGARVRNWDACQFPIFTLHASGHNPRGNGAQRQRQRALHKFSIYPDKFGPILCTGCGNCTRNCSVNLGLQPLLTAVDHAVEHL